MGDKKCSKAEAIGDDSERVNITAGKKNDFLILNSLQRNIEYNFRNLLQCIYALLV